MPLANLAQLCVASRNNGTHSSSVTLVCGTSPFPGKETNTVQKVSGLDILLN